MTTNKLNDNRTDKNLETAMIRLTSVIEKLIQAMPVVESLMVENNTLSERKKELSIKQELANRQLLSTNKQ